MSKNHTAHCTLCNWNFGRFYGDIVSSGMLRTSHPDVFFKHVEKSACTLIKYLSLHMLYPRLLDIEYAYYNVEENDSFEAWIHEASRAVTATLTPHHLENSTIITFCRNPYARLLSAYNNKIYAPSLCTAERSSQRYFNREILLKGLASSSSPQMSSSYAHGPIPFEEFVAFVCSDTDLLQDIHWRRQVDINAFAHFKYARLVRVESVEEDLRAVYEEFLQSDLPILPKLNVSQKPSASAVRYSEETASMVYQYYKCDFELFGYTRDSWQQLSAT